MALVQVSEATSSVGMQKAGFERAHDSLLDAGFQVKVAAKERHVAICKCKEKSTQHPASIRRLAPHQINHQEANIESKQKACHKLSPWIKAISNHI